MSAPRSPSHPQVNASLFRLAVLLRQIAAQPTLTLAPRSEPPKKKAAGDSAAEGEGGR
jgi:hypothetical protein